MKQSRLLVCAALLTHVLLAAQTPGDVLGMHNLSLPSGSSVFSQGSLGCTFCHAPHSGIGGITPLWNQTLSKSTYTPYTSTTYNDQGNAQPRSEERRVGKECR